MTVLIERAVSIARERPLVEEAVVLVERHDVFGRPRAPRGRLTPKQQQQRRIAALARWKGHIKAMPELHLKDVDALISDLHGRHTGTPLPHPAKVGAVKALAKPRVAKRLSKPQRRELARAAHSLGEHEAAHGLHGDLDQLFSTATPTGLHPVGGEGHNAVSIGYMDGQKVYIKPRPSGRDAHEVENERAGHLVAELVGLPHAHVATRRMGGRDTTISQGVGDLSAEKWMGRELGKRGVHGKKAEEIGSPEEERLVPKLKHMALADAIMGNTDRGWQNMQVSEDGSKVWAMDHGAAFPDRAGRDERYSVSSEGNYEAMDRWRGMKLTSSQLAKVDQAATPQFQQQLREAGLSETAIQRTAERAEALKAMARLPDDPQAFIANPHSRVAWMNEDESEKVLEDLDVPELYTSGPDRGEPVAEIPEPSEFKYIGGLTAKQKRALTELWEGEAW